MLSFRRALQLWPRSVRFFVLALALLQFVATTWHVCQLGGHVMARGATGVMPHGAAHAFGTNANANQPLICFCAAHHKPLDPKTPRLDGVSACNHATCLALLLQNLPGATTAPPAIFCTSAIFPANFIARYQIAPQIAALRRFRGRAPPLSV